MTAEDSPSEKDALARCFLLTDGIANVGVTDPERIASEAAGVREHTGISTSTFGIGNDYNELLLGPMAVAGGGQFHHLRTPDEITRTFVGELGGMLAVAARQVRLEFEVEPGVNADLVSSYWENSETERTTQRSIAIGDLQSDEERHVIVRFDFPEQGREDQHLVRARVVWQADEGEMTTEWQELRFVYASNSACDDEPQNAEIMHQVGLHEVDRARREAVRHNNQGDYEAARAALQFPRRMRAISSYAQHDAFLQNELKELDALEEQILSTPIAAPMAKEVYYQQQIRSRGQQDYRQTENKTDDEKDRDEKKPPKKRPWQ